MKVLKRRAFQGLFVSVMVGVAWGCGGDSEDTSLVDGGAAKAGASGSSTGGTTVGGMGGSLVGGSNSGGSTSGGSSSGGADGASAGGASGASTGGASTGGASTGGASTGGASGAGAGGASAGGTSAVGAGGISPDGSAGTGGCGTTQCTNCIDDDRDGRIDAADLQCTGAADDDEASYGTGIPGDNMDPNWQDCFFDGDSGAGNDRCRYHTGCLTGAKPPTDPDCIVSQQCIDFCMPSTPNGCDCFGCCSVQLPGGGTKDVRLGPECTPATINDAAKCVPCTKATRCNNDCGRCELCIGKTTIPPDCNPGTGGTAGTAGTGGTGTAGTGGTTAGTSGSGGTGGGCATPTCPAGVQACGVACLPGCPVGKYCLTGCCVVPPPR